MRSLLFILLTGTVISCTPVTVFNECGDKTCSVGETHYSCSKDCPPDPTCGDGVCAPSENLACEKDCGALNDECGDGECSEVEQSTCATDCGPLQPACGNGNCTSAERNSGGCPQDCGGSTIEFCGNRVSVSVLPVTLGVASLSLGCRPRSWTVVGAMIASYYGINQYQCDLAEYRAGNLEMPCCQVYTCDESACNAPGTPEDIDNALRDVLGLRGTRLERGLNESELQIELSNGRPVIIGLDDSSYEGRYAVISGFSGQQDGVSSTYTVLDPFYGTFTETFHAIAYGYGTGSNFPLWSRTWYRLALEADGCNLWYDTKCGCN